MTEINGEEGSMGEAKTYTGGCHRRKVRYEATVDLDGAMSCNCSRCAKLGWILTFTPAHKFTLISGESDLTAYLFNKHVIHHLFCSTCGIESFARGTAPDGSEMAAINIRCLDGVDLGALEPTPVDGKSF
jgi:hypothetical protein